jgi:hypothetical protein
MHRPTRYSLFLAALLLGCEAAAYRPAASGEAAMDQPAASPLPSMNAVGVSGGRTDEEGNLEGPADASDDPSLSGPMIIRTGQASVEIDSLELAIEGVRALAQRVGGFIANTQMQLGQRQFRSAVLEIKVPAARFDELLGGLQPLGKVEYVNITAQDVGEEFTDVSARVANGRKLESRLIDLLATRTGKLSDVLEIERELARVREEIERMEGRLRYLKAHAATSTLSLTVHEESPLVGDQGSGSVLGQAFAQAWRNFINFVAALIASLGVLLPTAVLGIGGIFLLRKAWRARRG